jgi:hypothetical protein
MIDGYSAEYPVRGLHIKNCKFNGVEKGNDIEFAKDLSFTNYYLNGELVKLEE